MWFVSVTYLELQMFDYEWSSCVSPLGFPMGNDATLIFPAVLPYFLVVVMRCCWPTLVLDVVFDEGLRLWLDDRESKLCCAALTI